MFEIVRKAVTAGLLCLALALPAATMAESPLHLAAAPSAAGSAIQQPGLKAVLGTQARPNAEQAAIASFYEARGYQPFWLEDGRAAHLATALSAAPDHGLPAPDPSLLTLARGAYSPAAELALMRGYLVHARTMQGGLVDPRRVAKMIKRRVTPPSAMNLLQVLQHSPDIAAHLASLAPANPDYAALQRRFAEIRRSPALNDVPLISGGRTLRPGHRGPRVAQLRARLAALDLSPAGVAADPLVYDAALEAAVRRFQSDQGLNTDGLVGPMTRGALNVGPGAQLAKLAVNMERLRWLNRPLGARHIIVNKADFSVRLMDGDRVLFDERVVIGRRDRQTPEFSDEMEHLVFNPTWYVPRSIATKDILPKLLEDPAYLSRSNMVLTRPDGGPMPLDPSQHDFSTYTRADFPYGIRQRPNAGNALGQVKFMFPNNHAIYLHDTPSRNLFDRDRRTFSSGCVRVRDPLRLAALLLAPQVDDPEGYIQRLLAGGKERYVHLKQRVPVHLTYRTVVVDDFGTLRFRTDVYGRDRALAGALRAAGVDVPAI